MEKSRRAAVIHDYLARKAPDKKTRILADKIFLEAMKVEGVQRWRRYMMYRAVRIGTWWLYRKGKR